MFRHFTGLKQNYKILTLNVAFVRKTYCTMSDIRPNADGGVPLTDVVNALEKFAPLSLADSWDNVGLLVEPTEEKLVSHILLTNDLTEDVMEEAIDLKTDMIISYHPLIFAPMKSVTTRSWKEKIVGKCLENKIAVYCPHTSFDCVRGGVNDWLASMFDDVMINSQPIQPNATNDDYGIGRKVTLKNQLSIEEVIQRVKDLTDLKYVRLARARRTDGFVNTIALCAGSGASVLKNVPADLYLTGEMLHHDVLDAVHKGTNVILTNHSDSERGFLQNFAFTLSGMLNKPVTVHMSKKDTDPLKTV